MALIAKAQPKQENRQFVKQPSLEAGTYPGRLVQIIDLGLQPQRPFKGEEKKPAQEVMWTYELVDAFMLDEQGKEIEDKPRWISESLPFYSLDNDKAKSTQRIKALDPDNQFDGDVSQMIGTPVNVTIVLKPNAKDPERPYENIAGTSFMRPRDAAKCPELVNPPKVFDLSAPDMDVYAKLPKWIQEKIESNLNFKGSKLEKLLGGKPEEKERAEENPVVADKGEDTPPWEDSDAPY